MMGCSMLLYVTWVLGVYGDVSRQRLFRASPSCAQMKPVNSGIFQQKEIFEDSRYLDCFRRCAADDRCQSVSYSRTNRICHHYSRTSDSNCTGLEPATDDTIFYEQRTENIVHGRYVCTNSFIGPDCQYYTNDASQYFSMDAIEDDILIGAKLNGTFIGSNYGLVPGAYSKYALHIRKTGYLNFGDVRYLGCFGGYLMECGTGFTMMFWLYVMDKNPIFKDPLCHSCYTAYYLGNGGHTIRSYGYAVFHQAGYIQMSVRHFLGVKNGTQRQIRVASRTHVGIGWVHVTATWNRQQGARLYTNGTLGIVAKDEDVPVNCSSTVNDYTIGALSEETYKRYPLIIDDLLFWDGVKNTEFLPNIWDYYQLA